MKRLKDNNSRLISALKRSRAGTAVIEFALSFPTLVIVTLIIFDIGRAMFVFTTVNNVAAEGARYISARASGSTYEATEADLISFIQNRAVGLSTADLDVDVTYDPGNVEGGEVTVRITYPMEFFVTSFLGTDSINIAGEAKMTLL